MIYSHPLPSFRSHSLYICVCACSATNLLSTEHTHCSGEENTAILSHPSVIPLLYSSFSTPMLFVSALSRCCFPPSATPPHLSFIPHHSLFSIMSVPTGQFFSFSIPLFPTLLSLSFSPPYISPPVQPFFPPRPLYVSCSLCPRAFADAASHADIEWRWRDRDRDD